MKRLSFHALARGVAIVALAAPTLGAQAPTIAAAPDSEYLPTCSRGSLLCPDVVDSKELFGKYIGHDEPSVLFYSDVPGSGSNQHYEMRIPREARVQPTTDGTGGTYNFQLHPAFWFGMALCDTMSSPTPGLKPCPADSDANIFDSSNPAAPDYIGNHPGSAFLEVQFYPPGWVPWPASQIINGGSSCDATQWCAAVAIFSLQRNETLTDSTGARLLNNVDCQARSGIESFNFAFLTRDGHPAGPPSPLFQTTAGTFTPQHGRTFFMNPGDTVDVRIQDTPDGLQVLMSDLTSGDAGAMTASPANGFQQIVFDPTAATCTSRPYAFHPMYATSSEHTRVPWAAHSYNVAASDEIGHFEYCPHVVSADNSGELGTFVCGSTSTASDPSGPDADDEDGNCAPGTLSTLVRIDGCTGTDGDFDSPAYKTVWPGSTHDAATERIKSPQPLRFSSPLFNGKQEYSRVAFEADLAAIETTQGCSTITGAHCTNPPAGAQFYPIFTTVPSLTTALAPDQNHVVCAWQFGGPFIEGTTNTFGGTSTAEYGSLLPLTYPRPGGPVTRFNDYRQVLATNPCPKLAAGPGTL